MLAIAVADNSVGTGTHLKLITCNIKRPLCISFTSYPRAFSDSLGAHSVHGQGQPETKGKLPSLPASTNQKEKGWMHTQILASQQ